MKMKAIRSSEQSLHIRAKRHYIPEDGSIHNYRYDNFKSYKKLFFSIKTELEEYCLLGCDAVWILQEPTFRRNVAPPSSV
jgi:hypothetical protein